MKKIIPVVLGLLLYAANASAQQKFEVLPDNGTKLLKGIIPRAILERDTAFKWYALNKQGYKPNAAALAGIKAQADSLYFVVFMGTWCEDSHIIIPKFFTLLDMAGFSPEKVLMLGTDHSKKSGTQLEGALQVLNVPSILVFKNGKEIGRVIEYGKYGIFDKELGDILKPKL